MKRILLFLLAAWLGYSAPAAAQAQPLTSRLSSKGRIMPIGSVGGFWSNATPSTAYTYKTWNLHADVAALYFLRDRVGIGAGVGGAWARGSLAPDTFQEDHEFSFDLQCAWDVPLGERWSLMLRPLLGYALLWASFRARTAVVATSSEPPWVDATKAMSYLRVQLSLPLLYAINESIALGFGPDVRFDHILAERQRVDRFVNQSDLTPPHRESPNRFQLGISASFYASF